MEKENQTPEISEQVSAEKPAYTPRPLWQVIAAWIGLILFLAVVTAFNIILAKGGL